MEIRGYLLGYALSAWVTGLISERSRGFLILDILAVLMGSLAIYLIGVPWLEMVTGMSWQKTFIVGMLPFLAGDCVKATVALVLARSARPMLSRQLQSLQM